MRTARRGGAGLATRWPAAVDRGAWGARSIAAAGATRAVSDGALHRHRLRRSARQDSRASAAAPRAHARFPRGPLRSGDSRRLSRLQHPALRSARKRAGVPVLYYIAPQLWAWRPGRARRFAAAVDGCRGDPPVRARVLRAGSASTPSSWAIRWWTGAARSLGGSKRAVASAPRSARSLGVSRQPGTGSRAALAALPRDHGSRCWPAARSPACWWPDTGNRGLPASGDATIVRGDPAMVFAAADAALVKSGTTTLEAALADTPMVVAYRVHPVTAAIARAGDDGAVDQPGESGRGPRRGSGDRAVARARPRRSRPRWRRCSNAAARPRVTQRAGLAVVRERLGGPGAADRVADMAEAVLAA